jgi:hypothetical protein
MTSVTTGTDAGAVVDVLVSVVEVVVSTIEVVVVTAAEVVAVTIGIVVLVTLEDVASEPSASEQETAARIKANPMRTRERSMRGC